MNLQANDLHTIEVKCPPRFISLLGYFGASKLLMVYQTEDLLYSFDGLTENNSLVRPKHFNLLADHPINREVFNRIKTSVNSFISPDDTLPRGALLLNGINNRIYIGPFNTVRNIVKDHAIGGLHESPLENHLTETQLKRFKNWDVLDRQSKEELKKIYSIPYPEYDAFLDGNYLALKHWLDEIYQSAL